MALSAALITVLALPAQQLSAAVDPSPLPPARLVEDEATAVPVGRQGPVLDGKLDDDVWRSAPVFGGFKQLEPEEGAPASEPTQFQVSYSDQALFIAVRAFDSRPSEIRAVMTRRDDRSPSDEIVVMIDSYLDRRTGYMFAVNAAGVKRDAYLYDDTRDDDRWDAVWDVAVGRDSLGWIAEFRIPTSQMRFAASRVQEIGFNVTRDVARLNEEQHWQLVPKTASGVVSRFGTVGGLDIQPGRRLEFRPYTVASLQRNQAVAGNPFRDGSVDRASLGGDMRVGLGTSMTLNATINPDFGQVEADPAEVNLSAFETFLSERRPFFTEGLDAFRLPLGGPGRFGGREGAFYSRRIGRAPQGRADARGGYAERVPQTTILGAAKLTGKTTNGWRIGLLTAVTERELASVIDSAGASFSDQVEPMTGYAVARVSREFRDGATVIGAYGTAVRRDLPESLDALHREAMTGGVDFSHRFNRNAYRIEGRVVGSRVAGSANAINRTQRSSARYFQRPDRKGAAYDPTRTSLDGYAYQLNVQKQGGGPWRWNAGFEQRSPGLELNDVGFLQRADRNHQWASVTRNWFRPGKVFRSFALTLSENSYWTHAWERVETGVSMSARFTFLNYWSGWASVGVEKAGIQPEALRGGPALRGADERRIFASIRSDRRKPVSVGTSAFLTTTVGAPGHSTRMSLDISWRPASNIELSADPSLSLRRNSWQYLRAPLVNGSTEYLFGDLDQKTVSLSLRGALTFRPNLSLQVFAQPFVSSGAYTGFSRVTALRAPSFRDQFSAIDADRVERGSGTVGFDLDADGSRDVTIGEPDFTVVSLKSNAVLRWEYLSGSTLFLVWQHGRSDRLAGGSFDAGSAASDLFAAPAENVVMIKLSYWLNP